MAGVETLTETFVKARKTDVLPYRQPDSHGLGLFIERTDHGTRLSWDSNGAVESKGSDEREDGVFVVAV